MVFLKVKIKGTWVFNKRRKQLDMIQKTNSLSMTNLKVPKSWSTF